MPQSTAINGGRRARVWEFRKKKNTSEGGFGWVFIGLRAVVDGHAVNNGGRDVAQVTAVPFSRACRG
jgi:hypothetical protein